MRFEDREMMKLGMTRESASTGRWRALLSAAVVLALAITVLPPGGQVIVHATPEVLVETLDALPEAPESPIVIAEPTDDDPGRVIARSEAVAAPLTFNLLGATAPESVAAIRVRAALGDEWDAWQELAFLEEEDGPDAGSVEAAASAKRVDGQATEPVWVGEATHLQVEVEGGDLSDVTITVIDSMGSSGGPVVRTFDTRPAAEASEVDLGVVSRAKWGADESLRSGQPRIASEVHMGIVHHTAHTSNLAVANSYSRAESPGIMRAMYKYHTQALGWSDLGYNVVIDRFGTVFEGRAGGFERGVVGAHARNFNTGSFGVAIMGNFLQEQASSAALASLERVIGIKSAIHGIDPTGWTNQMGGTWRPTILGHRDVGQTACPGRVRDLLPRIREQAGELSMRFPDVFTSSPHRSAVLELADAGVTQGCELNLFCPERGLNRAQASSFVVRAFGLEPVPGSRFSDVSPGFVHAPAINALAERGWLIGYHDGTFRPNEQMTRGQLATLLSRALDLPSAMSGLGHYPDVFSSHAHAPGIFALSEAGIRGNCGGGRFCPDDIVRRDSTASFVNMARHHRDPTLADR